MVILVLCKMRVYFTKYSIHIYVYIDPLKSYNSTRAMDSLTLCGGIKLL